LSPGAVTSNAGTAGQAATIYYVNPGNQPFFEKHIGIVGTGLTEYRHFIGGVAIYTQKSNATTDTKYLLKDHLGSTNVVTSSAGGVLERYSYDPFGKTRNLNGSDVTAIVMPSPSIRRGFTGHEMLPEFNGGFIHMNGRIYDPNLGRFMTADPTVQAAGHSQSYNRYSYVFNNPLGGTDPSGYFAVELSFYDIYRSSSAAINVARNPGEIFNWYALEHSLPGRAYLDKHVFSHEWGRTIGHLAIGVGSLFCTGAAPACLVAGEAHIAGYNAWLNGGDHDDVAEAIITTGAITLISASGSQVIGGAQLSPIGNILAHAALGCALGEASGGSCGQGALSHGITAAVDIGLQEGGVLNTDSFWGNMAISLAAGCLASHAGGGTCQEGARSSAIIYLYNSQGGMMSAPKDAINVDAAMAEAQQQYAASVDYSLVPDPTFSSGRQFSGSIGFRGIGWAHSVGVNNAGNVTSVYDGIGFVGNGINASYTTGLRYGNPGSVGIRLSGSYGNGKAGMNGSVYVTPTGVQVNYGPAVGNVNASRPSLTVGSRREF
jgi:RHS repeat-associated protein